jgi:cytochrome c-type biogenesis protein CcmH
LARATAQDGDPAAARAALEAMLAEAAPDAPWAPLVRREIEGLAAGAGPTRDEVAAAEALPAAERTTMIRGMVERLAQRLRSDGDDPDGWLRLMRAYAVLGERDKAREAAEAARRSLSHRPEAVVGIEALARELGLGS